MSDGPTFARIDGQESNNNNVAGGAANRDIDLFANIEGGGTPNVTDTQIETWREQERRQRSVRSFMMFLMMMMLMDGEEQARIQAQNKREQQNKVGGLRGTNKNTMRNNNNLKTIHSVETDMELYRARRTQDRSVEDIVLYGNHSRVQHLVEKNGGKDYDREIRTWAEEQKNKQTRAFYEQILKDLVLEQPDGSYVKVFVASPSNNEAVHLVQDPLKELLGDAGETSTYDLKDAMKKFDDFLVSEEEVWHYPWNATGFYRGDWEIIDTVAHEPISSVTNNHNYLDPVPAEKYLLPHLQQQEDPTMGVHVLPPKIEVARSTHRGWSNASVTNSQPYNNAFSLGGSKQRTLSSPQSEKLSLTRASGKVAFQLYSKAVPAMKELSLIDGYVKVADTNSIGYSTRRDILLRVHGVLIHSLGRLSLVANPRSMGRVAFLVNDVPGRPSSANEAEQNEVEEPSLDELQYESEGGRRRLQQLLLHTTEDFEMGNDINEQIDQIRTHALQLFGPSDESEIDLSSYQRIQSLTDELDTIDLHKEFQLLDQMGFEQDDINSDYVHMVEEAEKLRRLEGNTATAATENVVETETIGKESSKNENFYSKHVVPFPFAWDDEQHSLQQWRSVSMSSQERSLEINAGSCEFEINLDVHEEKWTVGQWQKLMSKDIEHNNSADGNLRTASTAQRPSREGKMLPISNAQKRANMEQAWVMSFNGTMLSPNCDFRANINSTAIRIDWEATAGKAMNYSFYMMTICLSQIVLLLRQLLHTQSQSASVRVSILCIGWQAVIDGLLCLVHVYFCLAMQPLFTAFASVAFFKLLIFCVIEMKYMAMIIQARNASNGGTSAELLRRQITMLHVRYYVALMASCLHYFYSDRFQTLYMLLLYSFWVPQIVHNVVTEAKKPMHTYYVIGMSLTRLGAPLYMYGNENNFLREIYPESQMNIFMCQCLAAWVGIQAAVLYAQSRFGARFFIPPQFLPPKYDYNRPIPASLLPADDDSSANLSDQLKKERELPKTEVRSLVSNPDLGTRAGVARNRKEAKKVTVMTAETVTEVPKNSCAPCLECVICYTDIDTSDRTGYMIAPCNHVFHKDCLTQWMEVKMECPICRADLPEL